MPSPVRPYPKRGLVAPSPLRQSTSTSRPSRKRRLSPDTPGEVVRPSKAARRSSGRQNHRSTKDEIDAFMAGEDESVVEGLVDEEEEAEEAEDENMTPIPDEIVAHQEVEITPLAGKKRSTGKGAVAPGPDSGNEVEAVQNAEGDAEGEEDDDLYSPGTLGTYPHL